MDKKERKNKDNQNNSSNNSINSINKDYLNYIIINSKNKIEEINKDAQFQQLVLYTNTLISENEDNLGLEINKFFNLVLEENKEGEQLKVCIALSNRINSKLKTSKDIIHKSINEIMNRKETTDITLTSDLSENISYILTNIFQKIKKNEEIKTFEDFINEVNKYNILETDILKDYIVEDSGINKDKVDRGFTVFTSIEKNKNISIIDNYALNSNNSNKLNIDINPDNESNFRKISEDNINLNSDENKRNSINKVIYYDFKEKNNNNEFSIPVEVLILKRKFQTVKKIKLILKSYDSDINELKNTYSSIFNEYNDNISYNSRYKNSKGLLTKKDVENNIYVLFNLKWIFPQLLELEIDLSDKDLIIDQININKEDLLHFSNIIKRSLKQTYYTPDISKIKIYDPFQTSFINSTNLRSFDNSSNESGSDNFDLQISENSDNENKINKDIINIKNNNKNDDDNNIVEDYDSKKKLITFDDFINNYKYMLQMIIIYGFFISKIPQLFFCTFHMPINFEKEIVNMLKIDKVFLPDFQFFSFISKISLIKITLDFNSLDNKSFEQVLKFLFKNECLKVCYLNFFPSEKYFEPEILLKLLKDCYHISNKSYLYKIESNEDTDIFLLRKLSEFFENNIIRFFHIISIKTTLNELSLIFDFPKIMTRNESYLIIILKLILNIIIIIDSEKLNLTSFMLQSNNIYLNKNKLPFLIDFFDKINIFSNKNNKLSKLTFQLKLYGIYNIYRIIPYNIVELSIGEFDYETFENFIEYITSSEFCVHSKLSKLQINLVNSILFYEDIKDLILNLFNEYPKNLKEININTNIDIKYFDLKKLLYNTNYNTIQKIELQFSKRSLKDEEYKNNLKDIMNIGNNYVIENDEFNDIFFVKKTKNKINIIKDNIMMNLSIKYNKKFMDYNIFTCFEKFICMKEKKTFTIQFK